MKLNYYTYTIYFLDTGTTCKVCIKDIVDLFCQEQKDKNKLEKLNKKTSKELYFAKSANFNSVYFLMTPTELHNYRSLDKSSGTIEDIKQLVGKSSLEKVTYVHIDDDLPVIGIASSNGGASSDDLEFYLTKLLNGLISKPNYILKLKPIHSGVSKSGVKNIKMLSEAKVLLRSDSKQFSKLNSFLNAKSSSDDIEIEIKIKRKKGSSSNISKNITPLLDIIKNDPTGQEFADIHLRGKANSLQENIKDILLDQTMILFDILYPKSNKAIEEQIQDKRYANKQVYTLTIAEFNKYTTKIKTTIPCSNWDKLKLKASY